MICSLQAGGPGELGVLFESLRTTEAIGLLGDVDPSPSPKA